MMRKRLSIGSAPVRGAGRPGRCSWHATGVLLFMVLTGAWVQAVESFPPLVPQGEKIENIRELVKNISRNSFVYSVAFSPDGNTLASGSADNTVFVGCKQWQRDLGQDIPYGVILGEDDSIPDVDVEQG